MVKEILICPECGQERQDDDRVKNGMKCYFCAGYGDLTEADIIPVPDTEKGREALGWYKIKEEK